MYIYIYIYSPLRVYELFIAQLTSSEKSALPGQCHKIG